MQIDKTQFTIFDFETTGLYPYSGDKICEIGAVRFSLRDNKREKFHSLVNPGRPISYDAFLVNGITEDMVRGKPEIEEILPDFMKFIKNSVLVAYNAGFDLGFLECALGEEKAVLDDYKIIDALTLARRLFSGIGRYNLMNVALSLGIDSSDGHRAMADALMTSRIFERELAILISEGVKTVDEIAQVQRRRGEFIRTVKSYKLKLIEEAIREERRLHITYHSIWSNKTTRRTITPKEIRKGYDKFYVIAHCHTKDEDRNFRLDGILDAKPD